MVLSDTVNDLIIFIGHSDLHFVVQQFHLISATLSDGFASFLELWVSWTGTANDLILFIGHCDKYFTVQ